MHNTYTQNSCPASTNRRKCHQGRATTRQTVTTTYGDGHTSKSYVDQVACEFCGHAFKAEWMPGLI